MRSFLLGVLAAAVLAVVTGVTLNAFQESSANAYRDDATTQFNQQENVNNIGRQG